MSQQITGDSRGDGYPSVIQSHGSNFYPANAANYNGYYPVKPTNPHMVARPPMQGQHMNPHQDVGAMHQQVGYCQPQFMPAGVNYCRPQFAQYHQQMHSNQYFNVGHQQYQYFQQNQHYVNQMPNQNYYQFTQNKQYNHGNYPNQSEYIGKQEDTKAFVNTDCDVKKIPYQSASPNAASSYSNASPNATSTFSNPSPSSGSLPNASPNAGATYQNVSPNNSTYAVSPSTSFVNRPGTTSRCESTRSEAESTCSSVSTEVDMYTPGLNSMQQMQPLYYNQTNDSDTNNNMNYQNFAARTNTVIKASGSAEHMMRMHTMQQDQMHNMQQLQWNRPRPIYDPAQAVNMQGNMCNVPNYCAMTPHDNSPETFHAPRMPIMRPTMNQVLPRMVHPRCQPKFEPPRFESIGAKMSLPPAIVVPKDWKRVNKNGQVIYISPSGVHLHSLSEIVKYLSQNGTCKCGLTCPLRVESTFCFDPKVPHRAIMPNEIANSDSSCKHRSKSLSFDVKKQVKKEDGRKKRKRKTKNDETENTGSAMPNTTPPQPTTAQYSHMAQINYQQVQTSHQGPQQNWNQSINPQAGYGCYKGNECPPMPEYCGMEQTPCCNQPGCNCYKRSFNPGICKPMHPYMQQGCPPMQQPQYMQNYNYMQPQEMCSSYVPPQIPPDKTQNLEVKENVDKKKKTTTKVRKKRKHINEEIVNICKTPDKIAVSPSEVNQLNASSGPSFMEDPNGYLAQQTALLNNTMSGGGVGQFSPQGAGKCHTKSVSDAIKSPAVVPLPSNVPLPARVSKNSSESNLQLGASSVLENCSPSSVKSPLPMSNSSETPPVTESKSETFESQSVATVESSSSHIVTVTYANSQSTTSTSKSDAKVQSSENVTVSSSMLTCSSSERKTSVTKVSSSIISPSILESDEANKPLIPGPLNPSSTTQSPLEMVQNIVSSIPVPESEEIPSSRTMTTRKTSPDNSQIPQVFNMSGNTNVTSVMYNAIRGPAPLVVHSTQTPTSMIMNSNTTGNVVVVTAPFNSKGPIPGSTSTVSGVQPVVGIPQVVQPSVQPHIQQPLQPIQPVVQLVNTFATMQGPVIIQNGTNLIQSSGVLPNQNGVFNGMMPSSFVANQQIIPPTTISVATPQTTPVLKVVSPNSEEENTNRSTPSQSTPFSSPGSEPSPSSGSRKRKRRNTSTPQPTPQPIMPAIIMGKQIQQPLVMNGTQIPQISPYSQQVATVMNSSVDNQVVQTPQRNAINVVQMVSGPVTGMSTGTLPVQVQQPTIIVPPAGASGFIINQLADGSFVSTDPSTGVSYPVQILSGPVGVNQVQNNTNVIPTNNNVIATNANVLPNNNSVIPFGTNSANTMVMRGSQQNESKIMNFSAAPINVYNVPSITQTTASNGTQYMEQSSQGDSGVQQFNGNTTVVQQKTTIVAQHTTVVTQENFSGTHSSVSTQTPLGESDVTSSDNTAMSPHIIREPTSTSPSHQSAEVTTTRQDEEMSPSVSPKRQEDKVDEHHSVDAPQLNVVWGTHRRHRNWPGHILKQVGGKALVRWYGDNVVESVLNKSLSKTPKGKSRRKKQDKVLMIALAEVNAVLCGNRSQEFNQNFISIRPV